MMMKEEWPVRRMLNMVGAIIIIIVVDDVVARCGVVGVVVVV